MEKKFVTVNLNGGKFRMQLIQFITVPKGNDIEVLAICMDEIGNFDTYAMSDVQGEGFD
jgi:hypothetical protein